MKITITLILTALLLCSCSPPPSPMPYPYLAPSHEVYEGACEMKIYTVMSSKGRSCGKYIYYINDQAGSWLLCTDSQFNLGDVVTITKKETTK